MAIQSNNSNEKVVSGQDNTVYGGLIPFKVLSVNPTKAELEKLYNTTIDNKPEYRKKDKNGDDFVVVKFIVQSDSSAIENPFITSVNFIVRPRLRTNKAGDKNQYIDAFGTTGWAGSVDDLQEWVDKKSAVKAFVGEEDLMMFIKAWANVATEGECRLDNREELAKGNVTELKEYVTQLKENRVVLLAGGVTMNNDKFVQSVYNKFFGRLTYFNEKGFLRALENEYTAWDAVYPSDLSVQEVKEQKAEVISTDSNDDIKSIFA